MLRDAEHCRPAESNALEERYRLPRLWEAVVDREPRPGSATVDCHEVTTLQQAAMPNLTGVHHARFAVLCAQAACEHGAHEREFNDWAAGWLAGQDSSGVNARELADAFEDEAQRGSGLAMPEELMLANAARAAAHASKLSWLAGRARDEENTRAIDCAAEAIHTAMRMARLDLVELAEQAVPNVVAPPPPSRPISRPISRPTMRILKPLPT